MFKFTLASALLMITTSMSAQTGSTDAGSAEVAHIRSEYADVLALQGTAKTEVLAIARVLRAKPEMAIDKTKAAGEYCFKSSQGTMVHYASQPEATAEDVVYEFDATQLVAAGLDPSGCPSFQPWTTWNPVNGISSRVGSSTLTISMSSLRQRSLLPSTLSSAV
jgi:hypothetical protein